MVPARAGARWLARLDQCERLVVQGAISRRAPLATLAGLLAVALAALVLLLPDMLALWLVAGGSLVALVALEPFSAFLLLPCAVAFGSLVSLSVAGVNIGPTDLLVGAVTLVWLIRHRRRLGRVASLLQPSRLRSLWAGERAPFLVLLALAAYLLAVCLSMVVALDKVATLKEIVKWSEVLVIVVLSAVYLRTERRVRAVVWATIGAATLEALYGFVQWVAATGQAGPGGSSLRVFGTFDQPNPYGGFLNFGLMLALALVLFGHDARERWAAGGASALLLGAQLLANSRGALLGFGVGLLVMVVVGWRRERLAAVVAAIAIPLLAIMWAVGLIPSRLREAILDQLRIGDALSGAVTSANYSTVERLAHWIAGLRMFAARPVLGVGAGNYNAAYPRYALPDWPEALGHAHNYYLNTAAETGILGCGAFVALTVATVYLGWYTVRRVRAFAGPRSSLPALALGLLASVVALAAHNLTDDLFVHAMELQFALMLGCQFALLRLAGHREPGV